MRVKQREGTKGSLKWIQWLVNERPDLLDRAVNTAVGLHTGESLQWRSPLREDDWAEYRDASWLKLMGRDDLVPALKGFWPSRGPQWDALAVSTENRIILVEAKAHVAELMSPSSAAGPTSAVMIEAALARAKQHFGVPASVSWTATYYQYANRLAHLYFLREHGVDAHLVFLYVIGDPTLTRSATKDDWKVAIAGAHRALALEMNADGVHEAFIDVAGMT